MIDEDDINDGECDIGDMGEDSEVCDEENTFFNPSVETETKKTIEAESEELKCELFVSGTKDKKDLPNT